MKTETPATTGEGLNLAPVITALHEVYDTLAESVKTATGVDLPQAVFVVKSDSRAWGHITTRPTWKAETEELDEEYTYAPYAISMGLTPTKTTERGFHEIMVSGENLARGARGVFGTVAHETAHAYNIASGIRDVDSNGRHNKKFKSTAEHLFGLEITKVSESIGWSHTEVPDSCAKRWASCLKTLEEAISVVSATSTGSGFGGFGGLFGGFGGGATTGGRNKNLLKAECGCGKSVRVSRSNLPFVGACRGCGEDFEVRG